VLETDFSKLEDGQSALTARAEGKEDGEDFRSEGNLRGRGRRNRDQRCERMRAAVSTGGSALSASSGDKRRWQANLVHGHAEVQQPHDHHGNRYRTPEHVLASVYVA
jgi:hypothetical protein